ncbi:MAG: HDOD domain-containing protein [Opitutae bacterium]|nr:HDOD domain-containing protein [Opitutae bacterium]
MSPPPDFSEAVTAERLVTDLKPLSPVAHVLARLQRLLSDPNSGLDDIAELIRLDAALTTRIIQISNSVWYRRGLPCASIAEAMNRVGFREVYKIVGVVASDSLVSQPLTAYGRNALATWRESVAGAFAAELLADRLGEDMPGAYMMGLLHVIGRLPINQYLQAAKAPTRVLTDEGFPHDHSGAEFALLGFTQADTGALMLTKLGFAPAVVEPIAHQYAPLETPGAYDRMAAILYAARLLSTAYGRQPPVVEIKADAEILGLIHLTAEDVLSHLPDLTTQLSRALQLTKV